MPHSINVCFFFVFVRVLRQLQHNKVLIQVPKIRGVTGEKRALRKKDVGEIRTIHLGKMEQITHFLHSGCWLMNLEKKNVIV